MTTDKTAQRAFLLNLTKKVEQLPMLPTVVVRLMVLSPEDDAYFEKVLALAGEDPALATRLIQVANSAANAPASPITTLQHAVARLGARQIAGLVSAIGVMRVFVPSTEGQKNLWRHAIQVAVGARVVAASNPSLGIDPEEAYLCGQLHDIGRFVMFENAPEELGRIDETNWTSPQELVAAEKQLTGFDHAGLGWLACKKWRLPELVTQLVKEHHNYKPSRSTPTERAFANLLTAVQMADFISVMLLQQPDVIDLPASRLKPLILDKCMHPAWQRIPVDAVELQCRIRSISDEADAIISHLGID